MRETEETRMVLILQLSHSWAGGLIPPTGKLYSLNPIPDLGEGGVPSTHPLFTDSLKDIDFITCEIYGYTYHGNLEVLVKTSVSLYFRTHFHSFNVGF